MRDVCKTIVRVINRVIDAIAVVGMMGTFILVIINVLGRYVTYLGSLSWSEEGARYLFILVCCLGLIQVTRKREHFTVTMLLEKLPKTVGRVCRVISDLIMMTMMVMLIHGGWLMALTTANNRSSALGLPSWILYALLIFSSAGMLLCMVKILLEDILDKRFDAQETEPAAPAEVETKKEG